MKNAVLIGPASWCSWHIPQPTLFLMRDAAEAAGYRIQIIDLSLELRERILLKHCLILELCESSYFDNKLGFSRREQLFINRMRTGVPDASTALSSFHNEITAELISGKPLRSSGDILLLLQEIISESIEPCSWIEGYYDPVQELLFSDRKHSWSAEQILSASSNNCVTTTLAQIADMVVSAEPSLIGLGTSNLNDFTTALFLAACVRIRSGNKSMILFGGYFFDRVLNIDAIASEKLQAFASVSRLVDAVAIGDGPRAFVSALCSISNGSGLRAAQNLLLLESDTVRITACNTQKPVIMRAIPKLRSAQYTGVPILFSRGCPYGDCTYCRHSRYRHSCGRWSHSSYYICLNPHRWMEVLDEETQKKDIKRLEFADLCLTRQQFRSTAIALTQSSIAWGAQFRITSSSLDDMLAAEAAGARYLATGVESFSRRVLRILRRDTNVISIVNMLKSFISNSGKQQCPLVINLMWNCPVESIEDFVQTMQISQDLGLRGSILEFQPLPYTEVNSYSGHVRQRSVRSLFGIGPILESRYTNHNDKNYKRKLDVLERLQANGYMCGLYYDFSKKEAVRRRFASCYWIGEEDD